MNPNNETLVKRKICDTEFLEFIKENTDEQEFDDSKQLLNVEDNLNNLLNYRITLISVFYNENDQQIIGYQLMYKNLKTNEIM